MKLLGGKWIAAAVLGLWLLGFSLPVAAVPESVTLRPGMESVPLAEHIQVLHDPGGKLTLEEVRSTSMAGRFIPNRSPAINHGITEATHWYRVTLQNSSASMEHAQASEWVLEILFPMLDYVDVHVIRGDRVTQSVLTGDRRQPSPQELPYPDFAIPLQIAPGEQVSLYVRVATQGRDQFPIFVSPSESFRKKAATSLLLRGGFYGVMLVMAVYNLIIFLWIRERAYLYYVLYIGGTVWSAFVISGLAREYLGGLSERVPMWLNVAAMLSFSVSTIFTILFGQEFLRTRLLLPRIHRLTSGLMLLSLAAIVLYPMLPFAVSVRLAVIGMLGIAAVLFASVHLTWRGDRAARFYLIAWTFPVAAIIATILQAYGVLPPSELIRFANPVGISIEAALLSLALADRIAGERRERERFARLKQYLPQKVADLVIEGSGQALLEPKRRKVTVLVMDLRGFTSFSETTAPEDVMAVLREFYETMGATVEKQGGTVEHFAGDSMLVFFNAPLEIPDPEKRAVAAALEMRTAFDSLRTKWSKHGHELGLGIGIADGYATIGAIGFSGRSQYAAIGAVTNLASRLCSSAKHGEILTTSRVLAEVESVVESESVGEQTIKGFSRPIDVVRVRGLKTTAP